MHKICDPHLICPRHVDGFLPAAVVGGGQPPVQWRRQPAGVLQLGRGKMLLLEWMVTVVVKVHDGGGGGGRVMLLLDGRGLELRAPRHVRRVVDVVSVGRAFHLNTDFVLLNQEYLLKC